MKRLFKAGFCAAMLASTLMFSQAASAFATVTSTHIDMSNYSVEAMNKKYLPLSLTNMETHFTSPDVGVYKFSDKQAGLNGSLRYATFTLPRPDHTPGGTKTYKDLGYVLFKDVKNYNNASLNLKLTIDEVTYLRPSHDLDFEKKTYDWENENMGLGRDDLISGDVGNRVIFMSAIESDTDHPRDGYLVTHASMQAWDGNPWMKKDEPSRCGYLYKNHSVVPYFDGSVKVKFHAELVDAQGNHVDYPLDFYASDMDVYYDRANTDKLIAEQKSSGTKFTGTQDSNTSFGFPGRFSGSAGEAISFDDDSLISSVKLHTGTEMKQEGNFFARPIDMRVSTSSEDLSVSGKDSLLKAGLIATGTAQGFGATLYELGGSGIEVGLIDKISDKEVTPTKAADKQKVFVGEKVTYTIDAALPNNVDTFLDPISSYEVVDVLDPGTILDEQSLKVMMNGAEVGSDVGSFTYDKANHTLHFVVNPEYLKDKANQKGQKFTLSFMASYGEDKINSDIINKAHTTIDKMYTFEGKTTVHIDPVPNPQASLTKSVDKDKAHTGDRLTYTLTVDNTEAHSIMKDAKLIDVLPQGLEVEEVIIDKNALDHDPQVTQGKDGVTVSLGDVSCKDGTELEMRIIATVQKSEDADKTRELLNTATLKAENLNDLTAQAKTMIQDPDIVLIKKADKTTGVVGDSVTWQLSLVNNGKDSLDLSEVTLVDLPGENLGNIEVTDSAHNPIETQVDEQGRYIWNVEGGLEAGRMVTFFVTSKIDALTSDHFAHNKAQAICEPFGTVESSDSVYTPTPILTIDKDAQKCTYHTGETASFDITVKNVGTVDAHNVTITDKLPEGLSGKGVNEVVETLKAGEEHTVKVDALVENDAQESLTNTASVVSLETPEKVSDKATIKVVKDETPATPAREQLQDREQKPQVPLSQKVTSQKATEQVTPKADTNTSSGKQLPKTADENSVYLWAILGAAVVLVISGVALKTRKDIS